MSSSSDDDDDVSAVRDGGVLPSELDLDMGQTLRGFRAGDRLSSRYQLERVLGQGGMGVVWLARDMELEQLIAVKFLPAMVALDPDALRDIKRETRRSLQLTHAGIVRIYDFVQGEGWAGISMEYVDGETLAALRSRQPGGCLGAQELLPWIEQLCAALAYAHEEARIVHRDLKPANLMVSRSTGKLKVADFGIAASLTESLTRVSVRASSSSGSPPYMSPQQVLGEEPSVADDIYSLGATLYDLLTGKPPFFRGNIYQQIQSVVPPSIVERRAALGNSGSAVPQHWEETVAACLEKEPLNRPTSVREVLQRLRGEAVAGSQAGSAALRGTPPPLPVRKETVRVPGTAPANRAEWESQKTDVRSRGDLGWQVINTRPELKGIGGWLLVFCVILTIISPIVIVANFVTLSDNVAKAVESTPSLASAIVIEEIWTCAVLIYGIVVGVSVWKGSPRGCSLAKQYLVSRICGWIFVEFLVLYLVSGEDMLFKALLPGVIAAIFFQGIFFVIWFNYFRLSVRVRNTYAVRAK